MTIWIRALKQHNTAKKFSVGDKWGCKSCCFNALTILWLFIHGRGLISFISHIKIVSDPNSLIKSAICTKSSFREQIWAESRRFSLLCDSSELSNTWTTTLIFINTELNVNTNTGCVNKYNLQIEFQLKSAHTHTHTPKDYCVQLLSTIHQKVNRWAQCWEMLLSKKKKMNLCNFSHAQQVTENQTLLKPESCGGSGRLVSIHNAEILCVTNLRDFPRPRPT